MTQESTRATTAPDLLEIARESGLRAHLTGLNAIEVRELLADFVAVLAAREPAPVACDKLLTIIGYAYQIAAAHDAPAHILDVLCDPEAASAEQVEAMLPYAPVARDSICSRCPKETAYGPAYCWECAVARELDDRPVYMERCGENSDYWKVITKEEHDSWIEDGFPDKVRAFYTRQANAESTPVSAVRKLDVEAERLKFLYWVELNAIRTDLGAWDAWQERARQATAESAPASAAPDEQPKWISVEDRLPECRRKPGSLGVEVIVYPQPEKGESTAFFGCRVTDEPGFYKYGTQIGGITHWLPIPAAPSNTSPAGADTSKESK